MKNKKTVNEIELKKDLQKINELLRDPLFAIKIAGYKDSNAFTQDSVNPEGVSAETVIRKSFKEDKIAINVAGFYAVECGIGALSKQTGKKPIMVLKQIIDSSLESDQVLLLNRFANATWKASQPFRGLSRITRSNFIVASDLDKDEIKKDYDQIAAAAAFLLTKLHDAASSTKEYQLMRINQLLKDKEFARDMAANMEGAYYKGQNKKAPPFMIRSDDTAFVLKNKNEENIAIHLAGFYALTSGVEYLSQINHILPSVIVQSVVENKLSEKDKDLLERFANATWKAGQPFRGLERVTREIFKPFDMLPPEEVEKDWIQITKAAKLLNQEFLKK